MLGSFGESLSLLMGVCGNCGLCATAWRCWLEFVFGLCCLLFAVILVLFGSLWIWCFWVLLVFDFILIWFGLDLWLGWFGYFAWFCYACFWFVLDVALCASLFTCFSCLLLSLPDCVRLVCFDGRWLEFVLFWVVVLLVVCGLYFVVCVRLVVFLFCLVCCLLLSI